MGSIKEKVLNSIPDHTFSADEIAEKLGIETKINYVVRILREQCKEGLLYQWIKGAGTISDVYTGHPKWEIFYLKRSSKTVKMLLEHRELKGYRFY